MRRTWLSLLTVAGVIGLSACSDGAGDPTAPAHAEPEMTLPVVNGMVVTPSGIDFSVAEWATMDDATREPYFVPMETYYRQMQDMMASRRTGVPGGPQAVTGNLGPRVLCPTSDTGMCSRIVQYVPGATATIWSNVQWGAATVADFAQFDLIYLGHNAAGNATIRASKNIWGAATTGRLVLTGVHFEHCGNDPNYGPCRVLIDAAKWVHGDGTLGTGLVLSTQTSTLGNQLIPTIAPYNGVTYSANGGGWDLVHITDPGHATMQTSTDASLSNFFNSSHSIFGTIGSFTSVAEICSTGGSYPGVCAGAFRPHILVTSGAIADQDGDGIPDAADNCPTVGNANQADANGNGVGDACESAPTVNILPKNLTVPQGSEILFIAEAADSDDPIPSLTFEWRVNGIVQSGATLPVFAYTFTADATIRVTVRDPGLLSGFDETEITILTNQPPVAAAGGPYSGNEGAPIAFDGSGTTDPDGDSPLAYAWAFDGGGTASGVTASNTWGDEGSFNATLTVSDPSGATGTSTATVTVLNVAPAVTLDGMSDELTLDPSTGSGSFSDPGADTWTVTVDYGDGSAPEVTANAPEGGFALGHVYADDGTYTVSVTVDDGDGGVTTATTTVTITNRAPTADASGTAGLVECVDNAPGGTLVTLTGAGSDPDGSVVSYVWTDEGGNVVGTGASATTTLGHGSHTLTLTTTDDDGATASDAVTIEVQDTTAPTLAFALSVTEIWPPNHKMVTVATGIGATDACDSAPVVDIQVTSNEPINGPGDGNTDFDWVVIDNNDGTYSVQVRSERAGPLTDRIYTVTVTATDASGNSTVASGTVTVPHDQGNGKGKGR